MNNRLKHVGYALARFCRDSNSIGGVETHRLLDGLLGAENVGRGQIDFVDDRNDFEAVIDSEISVGQSLRFDALAGVNHQQRALAAGQ